MKYCIAFLSSVLLDTVNERTQSHSDNSQMYYQLVLVQAVLVVLEISAAVVLSGNVLTLLS